MTNWGRDERNNTVATLWNRGYVIGGTSPNRNGMYIDSIRIYAGTAGLEVRLAVYTGGALDDPAGATLLWDAGKASVDSEGWLTITHPTGGVPWLANTITWLGFKARSGFSTYAGTIPAAVGDFQSARGRYEYSAVLDKDEDVAWPNALPVDAGGSFANWWYSTYVTYSLRPFTVETYISGYLQRFLKRQIVGYYAASGDLRSIAVCANGEVMICSGVHVVTPDEVHLYGKHPASGIWVPLAVTLSGCLAMTYCSSGGLF